MPDDNDDQTTSATEPVLVGYVVTTILAALAAFGVDVTEDWVGKLAAAVGGLLVVAFSAYITRSKVTPVAKVDAVVAEAVAEEKAASAPWVAAGTKPVMNVNLDPIGPEAIIEAVKAAYPVRPVAPPATPAPPDDPPDQPKPPAGLAPLPAPEPPAGLTW